MTQIALLKGDRVSIKADYRDALPVNMYAVERKMFDAKGYMKCYPGITSFTEGIGVDRGGVFNDRKNQHFRVSGTKLIQVNKNGTVSELGTISGSSQAAMSYSFNTQAVIADGNMYLYGSSGFQQITDSDLGSPIDCTWIDGYYFLTDGEYIYHTNIADETAIDPLKFATAEFMPDSSLGVAKTQDNKVIVFGRHSIEYFINAATEDFAFQRIDSRAQKIGIVATHAKCEVEGKWFITGSRRNESLGVYIIDVGSSVKVSTREVDKILKQYTDDNLSDMRMESRVEDDTVFVIIHLPNETLCFNKTIAETFGEEYSWSILKTGLYDEVYRGINGVFDTRLSKWICGDKNSSNIGWIDDSVFTHYDAIQEWLIYTPFVKIENMSIDKIEIETIPGHTSLEDAKVAVSTTYDGLTYGKEWFEMYGEPLDYGKRFILRRLGYVNDWVGFKFRGATRSLMAFCFFDVEYS